MAKDLAAEALLIGVNYRQAKNGIPELKYAERDAGDLAAELEALGSFRVRCLLGPKATLDSIRKAIEAVKRGRLFFFFFAGHGETVNGGYYLHPYDGTPESGWNSLPFAELSRYWAGQAFIFQHCVSILDACRSSLIGRGARGGSGLAQEDTGDLFNARRRGGLDLRIFYGCGYGECSHEIPELEHGLLTHHLVRELAEHRQRHSGMGISFDDWVGGATDRMVEWQLKMKGEVFQEPQWIVRPTNRPLYLLQPEGIADGSRNSVPSPPSTSPAPMFQPQAPRLWLPAGLKKRGETLAPLGGLARGSREAQDRQREYSKKFGLPVDVENRLGMRFRLIPPGSYLMGSPGGEPGRTESEGPQHRVEISYPLWVGEFPVTQGEWIRVMGGENPAYFSNAGDCAPVEQVSWDDCQEYLRRLCEIEGVELETYRLLSEAEWEYSCRAGSETALYNGNIQILGTSNAPALDGIAWYGGNSEVDYAGGFDSFDWPEKQCPHTRAGTHPAGLKRPNAWGLHDMLGNVWEWVEDDWHQSFKDNPPTNGSAWIDQPRSAQRVLRGGGWSCLASYCRSAYRGRVGVGVRGFNGLRLARTLPVPH